MQFSGKIAMVTGAAQGIGKAIAVAFAREKANLVLADKNYQKVQETGAEIERMGGKALCFPTDVTAPRQVQEMVDKTVETFGRIDILVNNAGILRAVPFLNATEEDWDLTLDVNLKGVFLCSQADHQRCLQCGQSAPGKQRRLLRLQGGGHSFDPGYRFGAGKIRGDGQCALPGGHGDGIARQDPIRRAVPRAWGNHQGKPGDLPRRNSHGAIGQA
jgi:NAD(P)-dependent dehydrogenase (short-subunit alcohol dehydrogenase family)